MLKVTNRISIPLSEIDMQAVRASGPGGQGVNKTSSAIHLFFNIHGSSLPEWHKRRALNIQNDSRLTDGGMIVIKAQSHRSQERNKQEALDRLAEMLAGAFKMEKRRRPTRPSRNSQRRARKKQERRSEIKALRGRVRRDDV